jgi:predicted nucleic acid-binding protein
VRWPKGRNTLSSAHDLASVPPGRHLFIDANIFIYHFTQSPLTAACTAFLQRVEAGDLRGSTSVVTLTEVAHRLMLLEAIRSFGLAPRTAVKHLKEHPSLITQLTQYRRATAAIAAFNVTVVPVISGHLPIAQQHCAQYGLLTNDALMIAVMHVLGLADLASNDPDLRRLPGLTIWQPQPARDSITNKTC